MHVCAESENKKWKMVKMTWFNKIYMRNLISTLLFTLYFLLLNATATLLLYLVERCYINILHIPNYWMLMYEHKISI